MQRSGTPTQTPHENMILDHPHRQPLCSFVFGVSLILASTLAHAEPRADCQRTCQTLSCSLSVARCMLEVPDPRSAKNVLRPLLAQHGESVPLHLLLVRAYLDLGNMSWARRLLYQAMEIAPEDCQARSFLIWFHLRQAELAEAKEQLDLPGCPGDGPLRGRWHLLTGTLARFQKQRGPAERALDRARAEGTLMAEDQELLQHLEAYVRPGAPKPISVRLEIGGGYTSDGLAGSPSDEAHPEALPSPVVTAEILTVISPPWGRRVRPLLELDLRTQLFTRQQVSDYSYLNLGVRPGLALGAWRLFYRGQLFLLAGTDKYTEAGPRWYYETHRGELDWAPRPWLTVMTGAGRSIFRERSRTRTELDGSLGLALNVWRIRLLSVLSYRLHWATSSAYNLGGGTVIVSGTLPLKHLSLRGRLLSSFDLYPDSAGYFSSLDQDAHEARRDFMIKGGLELWSPSWRRARVGLTYEFSRRLSSVSSYEYQDHRLLLRLRFNVTFDPGAPATAATPSGHVRLPYGVSRAEQLEDERIQDLLRQEDAARRGSSCVN